jgi:hypothetical protein
MTDLIMRSVKKNIVLLLVSSVFLSLKATALPLTIKSPAQVILQPNIIPQIPLNNKGMCGGDMAGGMIGPDCKLPKVRLSICDEFLVFFFFFLLV